jgi:hypothetical protein
MKLHKFAGADSYVGSFVWRLNGRVAIRSAVVKQMKNPIEKSTTRPILEPMDILRRRMTGMGRIKMAMSVIRFNDAFVHLVLVSDTHAEVLFLLVSRDQEVRTDAT